MKTNKKKLFAMILCFALAAVLAIGSTLAYLFTTTNDVENVFTFAANIKARLDEPNWDQSKGYDLTPGAVLRKDPQITNTSTGIDEKVAIRITFQDGSGTALTDAQTLKLLQLVDISFTDSWTKIHGTYTVADKAVTAATNGLVYMHNNVLAPGGVSTPVFYQVSIKNDISNEDYEWLSGICMSHTDDCFAYGAHDDGVCTVTVLHAVDCDPNNCDCTPVSQHGEDCPSLQGTLKTGAAACTHTVDSTIGGFRIFLEGAAVQYVDAENTPDSVTSDLLNSLFQ